MEETHTYRNTFFHINVTFNPDYFSCTKIMPYRQPFLYLYCKYEHQNDSVDGKSKDTFMYRIPVPEEKYNLLFSIFSK